MSAPRPGYVELLRVNRPFRLLWLGTVVSFLGDWLTTVAVLTMAHELSDSALVISGVLIAKTLPIFLVSPVAGPIADRVDRRFLMIASDLVRVGMVFGMIACWWVRSVELLLVVLTLRTLAGGFFIPARTASLQDLVTPEQLPVAVALNGGTWSVVLAFGAALGGVLTAWVGIEGALFVDALTFLASAALLWGLPPLPPREEGSTERPTFVDGMRHLRGRVYLPALLCLKASMSVSGGVLVLLPLLAGGVYTGAEGPLFLGALYASRGVGALLGSMGWRLVVGDRVVALQWSIVFGFTLAGVMYGTMAVAPSFVVCALALGIAAVGTGIVWSFSDTLAQLATTREVRGRLFAMEFGITMLGSAFVSFGTGALVDAGMTTSAVLAGIGVVSALPAVGWAAVLWAAPDVPRAV
ncbi:MAG: MFS transporter [Myxococcota bacterium]